MAFTGQLGNIDAKPGNFVLGFVGDGAVDLNQSFVDTLTLSDVILGVLSGQDLFDTLSYVDSMAAIKITDASFQDTLILSDGFVERIEDTLVYTDQMEAEISKLKPMSDVLSLRDIFNAQADIRRLVPDSLIYSDRMSGARAYYVSVNDSLVLTDIFSRDILTRSLNDTLVFTDGFDSPALLNRRFINDVIVFADGITVSATFNLNITDEIKYREVMYGARANTGVIINGSFSSIFLPAPEFNDFESDQSKMIVSRSMTGNFRTYRKTTLRSKHNWRFIISKGKKDELQNFLISEINNLLIVNDWRGKRWAFKLLSDSIEFTETGRWSPCGNKFEVTLEFEGQRYYG